MGAWVTDIHRVSGYGTDHELPHGPLLCVVNISMVSGGRTVYEHQRSPLVPHRLWTAPWSSAIAQTTDTNMASWAWSIDTTLVPHSNLAHGYQTWHQRKAKTMNIHMAFCGNTWLFWEHGVMAYAWPLVLTQAVDNDITPDSSRTIEHNSCIWLQLVTKIMDLYITLGSNTGHGHGHSCQLQQDHRKQHCSRWQHRPQASAWLPAEV